MTTLALTAALAAAVACTPRTAAGRLTVSPDVTLAVARTESGLDPLAIHDNANDEAFHPPSKAQAISLSHRLISDGHRPDLGLMQINAANLARVGLTVRSAFDPCASIRAGTTLLLAGYQGGSTTVTPQAAIRRALSAYNTGSETAGLATYTPRVIAAARQLIPALRIVGVVPYAEPEPNLATPACTNRPAWHWSSARPPCGASHWHFSAQKPRRAAAEPAAISSSKSRGTR